MPRALFTTVRASTTRTTNRHRKRTLPIDQTHRRSDRRRKNSPSADHSSPKKTAERSSGEKIALAGRPLRMTADGARVPPESRWDLTDLSLVRRNPGRHAVPRPARLMFIYLSITARPARFTAEKFGSYEYNGLGFIDTSRVTIDSFRRRKTTQQPWVEAGAATERERKERIKEGRNGES